ncbi:MAG: FIST domain containing protein, partial [Gammaproteobacteria bacterium]|nr:FIST domain containing protein [Gammaproteobacteria bacterium]
MDEGMHINIRKGVSQSTSPALAARELYDAIYQTDIAFAVFFCSPNYNLDILASELTRHFGDINLIGCTTAGEITPKGYLHGSLTGLSLAADKFEVVTTCIDDLNSFGFAQGEELGRTMLSRLRPDDKEPCADNSFSFMLIDGLCLQEELITSAL